MRKRGESGFAMLLLFAMAAAVAIMLYRELPRLVFESQRIREQDLIMRGEQYRRAIQLYVRQFKKYPASLDDLERTSNIRFLRRRYKDPLTGKDEWRLIHIDNAGVFTDSLIHKPEQQEEKKSENTFITERAAFGSTGPDPAVGGAQAGGAAIRGASDRPAASAEQFFGTPGGAGIPGLPGPGGQPGQYASGQQDPATYQQQAVPGLTPAEIEQQRQLGQQPYPYAQAGQPPPYATPGAPPVQAYPAQPGQIDPGAPQPGQVYPGMQQGQPNPYQQGGLVYPGVQQNLLLYQQPQAPGQPYAPPGVAQINPQLPQPGQPQPFPYAQQPQPGQPQVVPGYPVQVIPGQPPRPEQLQQYPYPRRGIPGLPGPPTATPQAQPDQPAPAYAGFGAGFGTPQTSLPAAGGSVEPASPARLGQGANPALQMIQQILTSFNNPKGNADTERFMRTIKEELIWLNEFRSFEEAKNAIGEWIVWYNAKYIHSSLGYMSPRMPALRRIQEEFEHG